VKFSFADLKISSSNIEDIALVKAILGKTAWTMSLKNIDRVLIVCLDIFISICLRFTITQ